LNCIILNQEANTNNKLIIDCFIKLCYISQTLQCIIQLQHCLVRLAVSVQVLTTTMRHSQCGWRPRLSLGQQPIRTRYCTKQRGGSYSRTRDNLSSYVSSRLSTDLSGPPSPSDQTTLGTDGCRDSSQSNAEISSSAMKHQLTPVLHHSIPELMTIYQF